MILRIKTTRVRTEIKRIDCHYDNVMMMKIIVIMIISIIAMMIKIILKK